VGSIKLLFSVYCPLQCYAVSVFAGCRKCILGWRTRALWIISGAVFVVQLTAELLSVASLGWVTPGAATEGVTPLFFPEKPGDLC